MNIKVSGILSLLMCVCCLQLFAVPATVAGAEKLNFPSLTNSFTGKKKSFFTNGENADELRAQVIKLIDRSHYKGLNRKRYHQELLHELDKNIYTDKTEKRNAELYFTDALISYCKDMMKSPKIETWISYDELSRKFRQKDDEKLMRSLFNVDDASDIKKLVASLEPQDKQYKTLLAALEGQIEEENTPNVKKIKATLAYYRWIHHFDFSEYIVVNIASAKLRYYQESKLKMMMKVVAGNTPTETPRFTAYCTNITTYPYWNVPRSIATKEILPFCQENEAEIDRLNMNVLDKNGKIIRPSSLNWKKFNENYFPYRFRQDPGCDNPLGVIKFTLTNPFDIYMHDTNVKPSFKAKKRFFSHGCIRLEDPVGLANQFLDEKLDPGFINDCLENQKPKSKAITPVPVFVIYMPAEVTSEGGVTVFEDVYEIL
jgi:murein L,D-transpeptidase YcbB/YkuD